MKKLLLLTAFAILTINVAFSQSSYFWNKTSNNDVVQSKKYFPETEHHDSWDSLTNTWVNIAHVKKTYNAKAELVEYIYLDKDSTPLIRETYEYNNSGKQISKINYLRDTLNNTWNQTAKSTFTYHQDTLEAVTQHQLWDKNNNTWRTTFRSTKVYSPFNDVILNRIEQIAPNDTVITLGEKNEILYDNKGRKTEETVIRFNTNTTQWDTFIRVSYFYSPNELIEEEITDLYDSTNNKWNTMVKQTYSYSAQDTLTQVERLRFDANTNDWVKIQIFDEIKWISWNRKVNDEANIASYILKNWNEGANRYDTSKHYSKIILDNFGSNLATVLSYENGAFVPEQEFRNEFDRNLNKVHFQIRSGLNGAWIIFFEQKTDFTYGMDNELLERIDWDFNFTANALKKVQRSTFENFFVLGLNNEKYNTLKLYPNPSNGNIFIDLDEKDFTLEVMNLNGQTVHKEKNNSNKIDLTFLESGVYILKITTKGNSYFNKVIIDK